MKVNCIHCGHNFTLDQSYADYSGIVRCSTCAGLLDIQTRDGMVRGVRPGSLTQPAVTSNAAAPAASAEELAKLLAQIEQLTAQTQAANASPAAVTEPAPAQQAAAAAPATRSTRAGSKTAQDL